MNAWITWFNALGDAWFVAAVRASWQGGLALLLAFLISRFVSGLSPRVKCWIWRLAYLKVLVAFFWITPVELPLLAASLPVESPADARVIGPSEAAVAEPSPQPETVMLASAFPSFSSFLLGMWFAGVVAGAALIGQDLLRLRTLKRRCIVAAEADLADFATELSRILRLRRSPRLLLSDTTSVPFVFGIWRPQIVFPADVLTMKHGATLRLMLAHEMAHVKRRDLVWSWLLSVTETLFFFHPLVWLARRESRLVQEMACDDLALRATSAQPADFGHMLLAIIGHEADHPRALSSVSVGIFETKQSLERRITQMKIIRSSRTAPAISALLVCAAVALTVPWRLVAQKAPESALEPKVEESAIAGQPTLAGESTPAESELLQKEVELLRKEIELAARHVQAEQEMLEAGRTTPQELLDRRRELLLLQRELASLERDPAAQEQAIRDALVETTKVLRAQKKHVELGTLPPTSQLGFEREVVRLERELRGLSRSLAERTNATPSSKPITSEGLRQTMVPTSVSGVVTKVMVQPGAKVKKGDPLIQFDDREAKVKLQAALSQVAAAEAALKLAELDVDFTQAEYRKQKQLFEQGLAESPSEVRGPMAAEAKLAMSRAGLKLAQAQAELARLALDSLTIRAPHEGTVSRILAADGQYVATLGRLLVEITQ